MDLGLMYNRGINSSDVKLGWRSKHQKFHKWFKIKIGNIPITWSSKKQKSIASLLTCLKYQAPMETSKEAEWFQDLLTKLGMFNNFSIPICHDNKSCI